jgi:hypothetical protein
MSTGAEGPGRYSDETAKCLGLEDDVWVEAAIDRIVQRRLRRDAAYKNAENAEQQKQREEEITREVERDWYPEWDGPGT